MKFFGSFGVGGKGVFDSRPRDQFGLGYYYINIDNPQPSGAASDQEGILTRRVWLRGLLQFCNHAVANVDA